MRIDFEEIKKWPLTTNKIKVTVDVKKFFSEYSIVSYYSEVKEYKNLAYEQLSDLSFLSVSGIRARWAKGSVSISVSSSAQGWRIPVRYDGKGAQSLPFRIGAR